MTALMAEIRFPRRGRGARRGTPAAEPPNPLAQMAAQIQELDAAAERVAAEIGRTAETLKDTQTEAGSATRVDLLAGLASALVDRTAEIRANCSQLTALMDRTAKLVKESDSAAPTPSASPAAPPAVVGEPPAEPQAQTPASAVSAPPPTSPPAADAQTAPAPESASAPPAAEAEAEPSRPAPSPADPTAESAGPPPPAGDPEAEPAKAATTVTALADAESTEVKIAATEPVATGGPVVSAPPPPPTPGSAPKPAGKPRWLTPRAEAVQAAAGATSEGVRLIATQMAIAGSSRAEIERRLRIQFGVRDADLALEEIFGGSEVRGG